MHYHYPDLPDYHHPDLPDHHHHDHPDFETDDSRVDYLGLLGSEDRARRFSEEVIDRKLNFFAA